MAEKKRSLPALHLKRSPLVFVLAQVRIEPVLKMKDYIPEIQEALRHEGFPGFKLTEIQQIVFGPEISVDRVSRWLFLNKAKDTAVSVTTNSIVLETSKYDRFDTFVQNFSMVLAKLDKILHLSAAGIVQRQGLRYVDLVRLKSGESWDAYVNPPLIGFMPKDLGVDEVFQRSEWSSETTVGRLVIRGIRSNDGSFLPPGLQSNDLRFSDGPRVGETVTILDIDHYSEQQGEFNLSSIEKSFWGLHDFCDRSFRAAVTEGALKAWEATDVG